MDPKFWRSLGNLSFNECQGLGGMLVGPSRVPSICCATLRVSLTVLGNFAYEVKKWKTPWTHLNLCRPVCPTEHNRGTDMCSDLSSDTYS